MSFMCFFLFLRNIFSCFLSFTIFSFFFLFFFFNDTATTEIYTLSLHDALPILTVPADGLSRVPIMLRRVVFPDPEGPVTTRSEEHTSELQSLTNLVCRLLLEKKKKKKKIKKYNKNKFKNIRLELNKQKHA